MAIGRRMAISHRQSAVGQEVLDTVGVAIRLLADSRQPTHRYTCRRWPTLTTSTLQTASSRVQITR